MRSPVWITGPQRSGTTAFALAASEGVQLQGGALTVNGRLPYVLRRMITPDDLACQHLRVEDVMAVLMRKPPIGPAAAGWMENVYAALNGAAERLHYDPNDITVEDVVRAVCAAVYPSQGLWGDKYNEYLLDAEFLEACFPSSIWIAVMRHPDEVIRSALEWQKPAWHPRTVASIDKKWCRWVSRWVGLAVRPTTITATLLHSELSEGPSPIVASALGEATADRVAARFSCFNKSRPGAAAVASVEAHDLWLRVQELASDDSYRPTVRPEVKRIR